MQRPIGVTLLAIGSALVGLAEVWRALVFMGWVKFTFVGRDSSVSPIHSGARCIWAVILAAIWFWVAAGFWNVRAYAWSFGNFMAVFTLIWGFTALLFGSTIEAETVPWLLAGAIFFYLNYPGVRNTVHRERDVACSRLSSAPPWRSCRPPTWQPRRQWPHRPAPPPAVDPAAGCHRRRLHRRRATPRPRARPSASRGRSANPLAGFNVSGRTSARRTMRTWARIASRSPFTRRRMPCSRSGRTSTGWASGSVA